METEIKNLDRKEIEKIRESANTTLKQLAPYHLLVSFINIRNIVFYKDYTVGFKFSGNRKINWCSIHLNSSDLYDMKFYYISKRGKKLISEYKDIFNDQLKEFFENGTGLKLSFNKEVD